MMHAICGYDRMEIAVMVLVVGCAALTALIYVVH